MRLATYLSTSRHGIFYFRWPLPRHLHPARKASDIKVSLGTRLPHMAEQLSRLMVFAGHSLSFPASGVGMRYEDIRRQVQEHFQSQLAGFRERLSQTGPVGENGREDFRLSMAMADSPLDDFIAMRCTGDGSLLDKFLTERGIAGGLPSDTTRMIAAELQKGYRAVLKAALRSDTEYEAYDFDAPAGRVPAATASAPEAPAAADLLSEISRKYLDESQKLTGLRPKTLTEKRDALALLQEIIGDKAVFSITKADARKTDDVLQKLPKNRGKSAATRNLGLPEMLALRGVGTISARTLNSYVSHFQAFMTWAERKGYREGNPAGNPFEGFRVRKTAISDTHRRKPFKPEQLRLLYRHLTENPDGLVRKGDHKWPTLIAMFSGARLNEVCQLRAEDMEVREGIPCFDFNDDDGKTLKNIASRRVVPIHSRLLELGLLDFIEQRKQAEAPRLFPSLTYSKQNGWGRNVGRWFNESLLPNIGMKDKGLVFHSFRHSMVTTLGHCDVQESVIKAIVGHTRTGVTQSVYNPDGYKPEQLKRELDKFSF